MSSEVAEDRTAMEMSSPSRGYSRSTESRTSGWTPASRTRAWRCSLALASSSGWSAVARASRTVFSISARIPFWSIEVRYESAATTNPGGTGRPARVSSPRLAPLPPATGASFLPSAMKPITYLVISSLAGGRRSR